ncbi:MAG: hypothetical protein FJ088_03985, partial [Deltaproteobacteria bacterium]|nr:hypothetical protein [Deltaproteobacteria bacterium]
MVFQEINNALSINLRDMDKVMPPTLIYNEGWMLRLVLDRLAALRLEAKSFELAVPEGCAWYSEALLPSPFSPRSRADAQGESWTHVDGAIGNFSIGNGAKRNLQLERNGMHFVIIEAKMYSRLAKGVKNIPQYGQAARNIACMAKVLENAQRDPDRMETFGFYVLAPEEQIQNRQFDEPIEEANVRSAVYQRIERYNKEKDNRYEEKKDWYEKWFLPFVDRLDWKRDVKPLSWESILDFLKRNDP